MKMAMNKFDRMLADADHARKMKRDRDRYEWLTALGETVWNVVLIGCIFGAAYVLLWVLP